MPPDHSIIALAGGFDLRVTTQTIAARQLHPIVCRAPSTHNQSDRPPLLPNTHVLVANQGQGFEILNPDAVMKAAWIERPTPERQVIVQCCHPDDVDDARFLLPLLDRALYFKDYFPLVEIAYDPEHPVFERLNRLLHGEAKSPPQQWMVDTVLRGRIDVRTLERKINKMKEAIKETKSRTILMDQWGRADQATAQTPAPVSFEQLERLIEEAKTTFHTVETVTVEHHLPDAYKVASWEELEKEKLRDVQTWILQKLREKKKTNEQNDGTTEPQSEHTS